MAEKRMFAKSVVTSDKFMDLPLSAQALYFHLAMRSDDDGFVGNPNTTRRALGASTADMQALLSAGYLIEFPSGVVAIRHWFVNNTLKKDRYRPSIYQTEKNALENQNGIYNNRTAFGTILEPQYSIEQNREEEISPAQIPRSALTREGGEKVAKFTQTRPKSPVFPPSTDQNPYPSIDILEPLYDDFERSNERSNDEFEHNYVNLERSNDVQMNEFEHGYVNPNPPVTPKPTPADYEQFKLFWERYPRKQNKQVAYAAFLRVPPEDRARLLPALESQKLSPQWNRDGGRYIPYPSTWLNRRRWEDETADSCAPETNNPFLKLMLSGDIGTAQDPSE